MSAGSDHLANCSIWTASQSAAFSACLRLSATRAPHVKCGSRAMQRNLHLEDLFVQSDWDKLMSPSNNDTRLMTEVVAARMHKIGLQCPSPDTLKRASAIIQTCIGGQPTAVEKRHFAWDVKTHVKKLGASAPCPFEYIVAYPRSPMELPEHVLNHACGGEARPVTPPEAVVGVDFQSRI